MNGQKNTTQQEMLQVSVPYPRDALRNYLVEGFNSLPGFADVDFDKIWQVFSGMRWSFKNEITHIQIAFLRYPCPQGERRKAIYSPWGWGK
ncbi:MAG TPA: hypothetical protein VHO68_05890 [Bacteroidales bacterium]|nr:hypothetical protein [Bacteroidales bacterium]